MHAPNGTQIERSYEIELHLSAILSQILVHLFQIELSSCKNFQDIVINNYFYPKNLRIWLDIFSVCIQLRTIFV